MAYDEGLAQRLRDVFEQHRGVTEKKMFGGIAFMLDGKMSVGIAKNELMVRVGPEGYEDALEQPHARPMDFTGRPLKGFVYVDQPGFELDRDLEAWVQRSVAFVRSAAVAKPRAAPKKRAAKKPAAKKRATKRPVKRTAKRS